MLGLSLGSITSRWKHWCSLYVVCLAVLMVQLDGTIVNVALPSIRDELNFPDRLLSWVVNAYMIPCAGFLLLGGRFGDHFGYRCLFLIGSGLFTVSSLMCGSTVSRDFLIAARGLQGLSAAAVLAVSLPLILQRYQDPTQRVIAIGMFTLAGTVGSSAGFFLGGILTGAVGWRWIFLLNVPVGVVCCILGRVLLPNHHRRTSQDSIDVAGALAITGSLLLMAYAAVLIPEASIASPGVTVPATGALILFCAFVVFEIRSPKPLISRGLLEDANFLAATITGMLWISALYAWFYVAALFMQRVFEYSVITAGWAFLPVTITFAAFSCALSATFVRRFGTKVPFMSGVVLFSMGMLQFAQLPSKGAYAVDVLPGMLLIGVGFGLAYNPLILIAVRYVKEESYGVATGILNSSSSMAGALVIAFCGSIASVRASRLIAAGVPESIALNYGYHFAFVLCTALAVTAALIGALFLRADNSARRKEGSVLSR